MILKIDQGHWRWHKWSGSLTLQIYAQSVNRWNLRTCRYLFAVDNIDLSAFTSTQRAPVPDPTRGRACSVP